MKLFSAGHEQEASSDDEVELSLAACSRPVVKCGGGDFAAGRICDGVVDCYDRLDEADCGTEEGQQQHNTNSHASDLFGADSLDVSASSLALAARGRDGVASRRLFGGAHRPANT